MNVKQSDAVGFIVQRNLNAATVFNYYGIDYYTDGKKTLENACIQENVPITAIVDELWDLGDGSETVPDFAKMNMIELSTYILRTHHRFTEKKMVFIRHTLDTLSGHYGYQHRNLARIKKTFNDLSVYLTVHMKHEEFIVFPYIQKMVKNGSAARPALHAIQHPISSMKDDHDYEARMLRTLRGLTNNYTPLADDDFAFRTVYNALKELEEDLKIHMYLENNILFPKAMDFVVSNMNKN